MSPEVKVSCEEARSLLSEYADRELPEDDLRRVDHHLRTCKHCAVESTIILNLKKFIETWDGVSAGEDFGKKVLDRAKTSPRHGSPLAGYVLALLSSVLVACGIVAWALHKRSKRAQWKELGAVRPARRTEEEPTELRPVEAPRAVEPAAAESPAAEAAPETPKAAERPKVEAPVPEVEEPKAPPGPPKVEGPAPPAPPPETHQPAGLGRVVSAAEGAAILRGGKEIKAEGAVFAGDALKGELVVRMADGLSVRVGGGAVFAAAVAGANGEVRGGAVVFDYSKAKPLAAVYKVKAGPMLVSMRKEEVVCAVEKRPDGSTRVSVLKGGVGARCPRERGKPITIGLKEGRRITLKSDGNIVGPEPSIDRRLFE